MCYSVDQAPGIEDALDCSEHSYWGGYFHSRSQDLLERKRQGLSIGNKVFT